MIGDWKYVMASLCLTLYVNNTGSIPIIYGRSPGRATLMSTFMMGFIVGKITAQLKWTMEDFNCTNISDFPLLESDTVILRNPFENQA